MKDYDKAVLKIRREEIKLECVRMAITLACSGKGSKKGYAEHYREIYAFVSK